MVDAYFLPAKTCLVIVHFKPLHRVLLLTIIKKKNISKLPYLAGRTCADKISLYIHLSNT